MIKESSAPLSVSAALALAKKSLESFTVKLIGEVSEVSNKSGYKAVYFSVKDAGASLPCMMWLNRYESTGVSLRVGMLVELAGRFTLYAPKGRMNFDVSFISLAGEGNLRLQVANLAKKLSAEGLTSPERKRQLPQFPQVIGLVTSPRGAAVHDVLRTLRRRYPLARIVLAGVAVEGDRAAVGLIEALTCVQAAGAEVILLVRGGGSFEDLMPFNDESLARTIASMAVPVVTGIGHEPDTSIADMVSDVRSSTPTAAAEAVSPAWETIDAALLHRSGLIANVVTRIIERATAQLNRVATRPIMSDPNTLFAVEAQTLDMLGERLTRSIPLNLERDATHIVHIGQRLHTVAQTITPRFESRVGNLQQRAHGVSLSLLPRFENQLALAASRLHDLSPLTVLARGYSITKDDRGVILKSVKPVVSGDRVSVDLSDGVLDCVVEGVHEVESTLIVMKEQA